ncbi:MAG: DUF1217 domain-containing protein [Pelagimonas sp.]|jgi:hypothetical protein|nr:DUF1217 domain-containing protein [Pelagimonas sp.]
MSFQPVLVGTGLVGWQFLKATRETQQTTFNASTTLQRDVDYFAENIGNITTAEALVEDRRLLSVALTAFGLQDDLPNKFFIQKVLEEGTLERSALANKMADDRYKDLSRAFGFDNPVAPRTQLSAFPNEILEKYKSQEFEIAVGNQDETLRLALNFERNLPEVAATSNQSDVAWFRVMGTTALRNVFETALGLPSGFGQLDIDKQLEVFRDKSQSRFGVSEISEISEDPEIMNKVIQTYLLQTQVQQTASIGASQVALSLLSQIPTRSLLG